MFVASKMATQDDGWPSSHAYMSSWQSIARRSRSFRASAVFAKNSAVAPAKPRRRRSSPTLKMRVGKPIHDR